MSLPPTTTQNTFHPPGTDFSLTRIYECPKIARPCLLLSHTVVDRNDPDGTRQSLAPPSRVLVFENSLCVPSKSGDGGLQASQAVLNLFHHPFARLLDQATRRVMLGNSSAKTVFPNTVNSDSASDAAFAERYQDVVKIAGKVFKQELRTAGHKFPSIIPVSLSEWPGVIEPGSQQTKKLTKGTKSVLPDPRWQAWIYEAVETGTSGKLEDLRLGWRNEDGGIVMFDEIDIHKPRTLIGASQAISQARHGKYPEGSNSKRQVGSIEDGSGAARRNKGKQRAGFDETEKPQGNQSQVGPAASYSLGQQSGFLDDLVWSGDEKTGEVGSYALEGLPVHDDQSEGESYC